MMKVYGIPNCSTVKKSIDWLKSSNLNFEFHDYKKKGISEEKLQEWSKKLGWEKLVNKKGTTWRTLDAEQKQRVTDHTSAIALMIEKPSVIKRPVIEYRNNLLVGFDEKAFGKSLKKKQAGQTS